MAIIPGMEASENSSYQQKLGAGYVMFKNWHNRFELDDFEGFPMPMKHMKPVRKFWFNDRKHGKHCYA